MAELDAIDRAIVNRLQDGLPIAARPYAQVAAQLGIGESELIARLRRLLEEGVLSRFGPMFNMDALGGAVCLAAMAVPRGRFEEVARLVNAHEEVAHNYERAHRLNMWFVIAAQDEARVRQVAARIERETGLEVLLFPKLAEYFIGLKVPA